MAGIVGTTTNVISFISKANILMSIKPNTPQEQRIELSKDRLFIIPEFQRELRWESNNVKMLLSDLARGPKFLGNIILSVHDINKCEIIDGQQRTTILMLIIQCIKRKYGKQLSIPELCPLNNESFPAFYDLLQSSFDIDSFSLEKKEEILASDYYHQYPRIQTLWNEIYNSELLSDRHKAQSLLDNIGKSEFNVIASYSDDINTSIQYFLDVNLKGIRLDSEDIFKGYLFSQDTQEETRKLWQENKRKALRLNAVEQTNQEKRYPLMKLYEHFFYCDLYLPRDGSCEFSAIKFGENFCLTSEFISGSTIYYEGSHLIEAIRDIEYLRSVLSRLNKCIDIMIEIVESDTPSKTFKDRFVCSSTIDSIEIGNCHTLLKKILLEKEIIPKILALKYILTYFDGNSHSKTEYKSIYTVFCASVIFTIFANKKESETFYNFVRANDWINRIDEWLYDYISSHALTKGKVLAAYKYSENDDNILKFRCKSLAAINNFFRINKTETGYRMKITNAKSLNNFMNDNSKYSVEHFIICEHGTLHIKTDKFDFAYSYPKAIKKYKNSLFNYIFIPQELNSNLSNWSLLNKVTIISKSKQEIECAYSKAIYSLFIEHPRIVFSKYPTAESIDRCSCEDDVRDMLDNYFSKVFPDEFLEFSVTIAKQIKLGN